MWLLLFQLKSTLKIKANKITNTIREINEKKRREGNIQIREMMKIVRDQQTESHTIQIELFAFSFFHIFQFVRDDIYLMTIIYIHTYI